MWSCSNPSQPCRASRWTRSASPSALERWTTKYGLVAQKAAAAATSPIASRRHWRQPATTSGTSRKIPGYLKLIAIPAARPGELDPAGDHQRERHRDGERQRDVGDGHARVRDVRRLDRDRRRRDRARRPAVGPAAQPPGRRHRADGEHEHDGARGQVGRMRLPGLERGDHVHQQRRVVEPVRIETAAVGHVPRPRDDALLVGAEEGERVRVGDADDAERRRDREDRGEGELRPAPERLRPPSRRRSLRRRGGFRRRARQRSRRARSRRPFQRARARPPRRGR